MDNRKTVQIHLKTYQRLQSIGKFNETFDDVITMLLWCWAKPSQKAQSGIDVGRTVFPQFTETEINTLLERLQSKMYGKPLKTPQQLKAEMTE